jgi:hypothetical protein
MPMDGPQTPCYTQQQQAEEEDSDSCALYTQLIAMMLLAILASVIFVALLRHGIETRMVTVTATPLSQLLNVSHHPDMSLTTQTAMTRMPRPTRSLPPALLFTEEMEVSTITVPYLSTNVVSPIIPCGTHKHAILNAVKITQLAAPWEQSRLSTRK